MNVANEEQVKAGFQLAKDIYGKCVDILISNAGYVAGINLIFQWSKYLVFSFTCLPPSIQHIDPVDELSFDNWRKVIGVHLDGLAGDSV